MPKKPARNSFYYFMQHYKEEQRKEGVHYNNMAEVADAAGPVWKDVCCIGILTQGDTEAIRHTTLYMKLNIAFRCIDTKEIINAPPSVRTKFEAMAKAEKHKNNMQPMKFTTLGQSVAELERRQKDEQYAEEQEIMDIKHIVRRQASLLSQVIYVMDVNYYCRTSSNLYVVCEFTVTRFNLLEGILDELHEKVDPGEIPPGYTSDAKLACDELAITLPDSNNRSDYSMFLASIHEYLMDSDPKPKRVPPVFTLPSQVAAINNFFQQLCHYSDEDEAIFRVYKLDTLFYHLINNIRKDAVKEGFPNKSLALVTLSKDSFQYYPMLACEHHETTEKFLKCTASRVKRWCYTMLDYCCPLQQIKMEPGKHLPNTMDLEKVMAVKDKQSERRGATLANNFEALETESNASQLLPHTWGSVAGSDITSSSRPYTGVLRKPAQSETRNWVEPPKLTQEPFPKLFGAGRGSSASLASEAVQKPGGHGRGAYGSFELDQDAFPQLGSRGRGKK